VWTPTGTTMNHHPHNSARPPWRPSLHALALPAPGGVLSAPEVSDHGVCDAILAMAGARPEPTDIAYAAAWNAALAGLPAALTAAPGWPGGPDLTVRWRRPASGSAYAAVTVQCVIATAAATVDIYAPLPVSAYLPRVTCNPVHGDMWAPDYWSDERRDAMSLVAGGAFVAHMAHVAATMPDAFQTIVDTWAAGAVLAKFTGMRASIKAVFDSDHLEIAGVRASARTAVGDDVGGQLTAEFAAAGVLPLDKIAATVDALTSTRLA
jgi:hypothetical protein